MDPLIAFPYRFHLKAPLTPSLETGREGSLFIFSLGNIKMMERKVWFKILLIDYMSPLINFMDPHTDLMNPLIG